MFNDDFPAVYIKSLDANVIAVLTAHSWNQGISVV
jgi:hypothetical protein